MKRESMPKLGARLFDFDKELLTTIGCNDSILFVCPEGLAPMVVDLNQSDSLERSTKSQYSSSPNSVGPSKEIAVARFTQETSGFLTNPLP